jgi:hypothetical protein
LHFSGRRYCQLNESTSTRGGVESVVWDDMVITMRTDVRWRSRVPDLVLVDLPDLRREGLDERSDTCEIAVHLIS